MVNFSLFIIDEHLSIVSYLKESGINGALIVTTCSSLSLLDVSKEIKFCIKVGIPILGLIENMSTFKCKCGSKFRVFPGSSLDVMNLAKEYDIPFLGSIPLDPNLGKSSDLGLNFSESYPTSEISEIYKELVTKIFS